MTDALSDNMKRAREARKKAAEEGRLTKRNPLQMAADAPTNVKLAVKAKCFDCVGGEAADKGYRITIKECPAKRCPLYAVRPYQSGEE